LHKSEKGEAFADKNPDLTDKSGRKCFAPTGKNRLLQEVYCVCLPTADLDLVEETIILETIFIGSAIALLIKYIDPTQQR
jgi:hypothetical protein